MFRDELDALNAIYQEQRRTNELLEKLAVGKEGTSDARKGRSGGNRRKIAELPVAAVDHPESNTGAGSDS